ncbi:serine aminopeptidase domain-containing protein [Desulfovibrio legallii]|jgi:pimeloyl-ACP methyl ester carboxylesterase|uniref:Serine aminopeptidase, S33 n=1 Tax=Desulfovibrio legallii TaxID=571438 RepID=A0A1G7MWF1_9BACT|nr:alpha/beta hydrolase [Desulfovibrio legallii]SDF66074.1 Serine aminopeptidase, S33 [Desulfovibrio legallii]
MPPFAVAIHRLGPGRRACSLEYWPNPGAGVVLFYPGTMLSPLQYRPLILALRRAGLAVAALHHTGHGINPHRVGFTFNDLLGNGFTAEAWLRQRGHTALAVCGHSQGGILTLAHAAASPRLAAALPICAALPQQEEAIGITRFAAFARQRERIVRCTAAAARLLPRLPLPVQAYLSVRRITAGAHGVRAPRRGARWSYPLAFLASLFQARVPPRQRCALCFFAAPDDALFTPALSRSAFALLEAPAKRLVWLPGGGHLAAMQPRVCTFLARHAAAFCAGQGLPLRLTRACPCA